MHQRRSLIDFVKMAKWLMDENQQPSVTQELGKLFPSIRGGGRRVKAVSFFGLVLDNWKNMGIKSNIKETTEVYVALKNLRKNSQLICYSFLSKTQWSQICYLVHVISQVWSSATVVWSFPNKKWVILSHSSLVEKEYNNFELALLQFVIFKPLSYCFGETIGFDVKASLPSRQVSRLISWHSNQVI